MKSFEPARSVALLLAMALIESTALDLTPRRTTPSAKWKSNCLVSDQPNCPWCVKLYRTGKDRRRLPSGFFCMGTLIGNDVILTTGSCEVQARSQKLWAQVPDSAEPNTNYTVIFRLIHPEFNSGTLENNLALLRIDRVVAWGRSGPKGACLGLESHLLTGDCVAAGINNDESIHMTPLFATQGNCGRGASSDASCGHIFETDCVISIGSPVMCSVQGGHFMMMGLAKMPCLDDPPKALLSNLVQAEEWLNDLLKGTMGLTEKDYLFLGPF